MLINANKSHHFGIPNPGVAGSIPAGVTINTARTSK